MALLALILPAVLLTAAASNHTQLLLHADDAACPGPDPKHCDCSFTHGGKSCKNARDDGSECFCRCCCQYKTPVFKCKWHDPHPRPSPPAPPSPPPPSPPSPTPPPSPPPGPPGPGMTAVRVRGNRLVDQSGRQIVLRGVSHSGSEYTCVHGHGVFEGAMDSTFVAGLKSWKNLNAVRLPLNEDCWLGINGVPSDSGGAAYQAAYKKTVDLLTSANIAGRPRRPPLDRPRLDEGHGAATAPGPRPRAEDVVGGGSDVQE